MKALLSLLIILAASTLAAQDHPAISAQPNSVYVGADGKFEANPDTAILQFNISSQDENSRAAYDRASKAADQIRQILRSMESSPRPPKLATSPCSLSMTIATRSRSWWDTASMPT